jgi:hypothetical protein
VIQRLFVSLLDNEEGAPDILYVWAGQGVAR